MAVNVIVQARMSSKRLPGKVMMEMAGKPMIGHLVDHLQGGDLQARHVIYAIPSADQGGPLWHYLKSRGCLVETGPETDVAARFELVLKKWSCDRFIRICADSPVCDTSLVNHLIEGNPGIAYDQIMRAPGTTVQICNTSLFLHMLPSFTPQEREHVLLKFVNAGSYLVDTSDDFKRVVKIIETGTTDIVIASSHA